MNCAHEPQDVACNTASQAWNIAESREPPVPLPPLLTHACFGGSSRHRQSASEHQCRHHHTLEVAHSFWLPQK